MNFERIRPSIDVDTMQQSNVTVIGGAVHLAADLVRSGLGSATLVDFDTVDATNPARQDFATLDIGRRKVEAAANHLLRINPDLDIETLSADFCSLSPEQMDDLLGHADLVIDGTDFFPVHARLNQEILRLGKPAMWIGLYRGGRAGEIVHVVPGVTDACYRCVCQTRYDAFSRGAASVSSAGGTILDLHLVDAVAGQIAVGMVTRGADNRFGRMIDRLGQRSLSLIKIDPEYTLGERDIFAEYLGEDAFSFSTLSLATERNPDCPDCSVMHHALEVRDATHQSTHAHA